MGKWPHLKLSLEPNLVYWYNMGLFVCHVVKDQVSRSKVIRGQLVRWADNVKLTSFEN